MDRPGGMNLFWIPLHSIRDFPSNQTRRSAKRHVFNVQLSRTQSGRLRKALFLGGMFYGLTACGDSGSE